MEKRGPFAGINPSWQRITNGIKYRKSLGDFAVALSLPIEMIVGAKNPLLYFDVKAKKNQMSLKVDDKFYDNDLE